MQWTTMTTAQKAAARLVRDRLADEGVAVSVSAVARHFEKAMDWQRGQITLASLREALGA